MENLSFIRIVKDQAYRQVTWLLIFIKTKKRKNKNNNECRNKINHQLSAKEKDMLSTESKAVNHLTGIFQNLSILKKITKHSDINHFLVPLCPEADTMIKGI